MNSRFARLDEIKIESNNKKKYRIDFFSTLPFFQLFKKELEFTKKRDMEERSFYLFLELENTIAVRKKIGFIKHA